MTSSLDRALAYAKQHDARFLQELAAWCAAPPVSPQAAPETDIQPTVEWGAKRLRRAGLRNVAVLPTPALPVIYGDWLGAGDGRPTVLVCGRYGAQPAQHKGWNPTARDAWDIKGKMLASVAAAEAHLQSNGSLPVNVKFLIHGDQSDWTIADLPAVEEIAAGNLRALARKQLEQPDRRQREQQQRQRLACDYFLNVDSGVLAPAQFDIEDGVEAAARAGVAVLGPRSGIRTVRRVLQASWGAPALFDRIGASIAALAQVEGEAGIASVLAGCTVPDEVICAPEEHLHLPSWRRGVRALTRFFAEAQAR